jgi:carbon monoxide dehydrogenase subunit G
MTIEESIHIRVSKEVLFDYLMDVKNRKDYIPALEEVIMIDPLPIRKGSKYIEVANIGGMRLETTYEVIRFQLNERITAKTQKSIFPIQADLSLEENENGTLIIIQLDFKLAGPFRLASRIVSGIVRQQARGILENIKHELENS